MVSPRMSRDAAAARRERRAAVTDVAEVLAAGARSLEVRPRSVAEIRRSLTGAGFDRGLIETAIGRLLELGYLDDRAFARAWVASRDRARPRAASALRSELRRRGVAADDAEAALAGREAAAIGDDPFAPEVVPAAGERAVSNAADGAAAARLLERKRAALLREPDPRKRRARAYALLARNAFDPSTAAEAVRSWIDTGDVDVEAEAQP
jgi:SOS response regulatory protein OraA/RecX